MLACFKSEKSEDWQKRLPTGAKTTMDQLVISLIGHQIKTLQLHPTHSNLSNTNSLHMSKPIILTSHKGKINQ